MCKSFLLPMIMIDGSKRTNTFNSNIKEKKTHRNVKINIIRMMYNLYIHFAAAAKLSHISWIYKKNRWGTTIVQSSLYNKSDKKNNVNVGGRWITFYILFIYMSFFCYLLECFDHQQIILSMVMLCEIWDENSRIM